MMSGRASEEDDVGSVVTLRRYYNEAGNFITILSRS
jgi:hypothetical protein